MSARRRRSSPTRSTAWPRGSSFARRSYLDDVMQVCYNRPLPWDSPPWQYMDLTVWGTWLRSTTHLQLGLWRTQREGKTRLDFLMQRGILKTIDWQENISMAMQFAPPLPLSSGKSGWYLWSAACDFAGVPRYDIPSGIAFNWYLQDGLHVHKFPVGC